MGDLPELPNDAPEVTEDDVADDYLAVAAASGVNMGIEFERFFDGTGPTKGNGDSIAYERGVAQALTSIAYSNLATAYWTRAIAQSLGGVIRG